MRRNRDRRSQGLRGGEKKRGALYLPYEVEELGRFVERKEGKKRLEEASLGGGGKKACGALLTKKEKKEKNRGTFCWKKKREKTTKCLKLLTRRIARPEPVEEKEGKTEVGSLHVLPCRWKKKGGGRSQFVKKKGKKKKQENYPAPLAERRRGRGKVGKGEASIMYPREKGGKGERTQYVCLFFQSRKKRGRREREAAP